ncbi:hypothetical protein PIB30_095885 [Stylosanthes scabra]|uniref:Uncharacterized protein n=1 Tax=Stylosanthes scabra TaxID=79078 RepID=A0ABU6SWB9_9FABA|nr:hypothetical protein [Stylosanthes scabra]
MSKRGLGVIPMSLSQAFLTKTKLHLKIAPPNKSPKKKAKEDKGKSIGTGEFTHIPTIPHVPYPFALVGRKNRAPPKDVPTTSLIPHKNMLSIKLSDDKQALGGRQLMQQILTDKCIGSSSTTNKWVSFPQRKGL